MVTTLYLIAVAAWYSLSTFEGNSQIEECIALKQHIEKNFDMEATCVSRQDNLLIHDSVAYINTSFKNN